MKLTIEEYRQAEDQYMGYCVKCDDLTRGSTEPDAEGYDCEECGENTVMGTMNALLEGHLEIT